MRAGSERSGRRGVFLAVVGFVVASIAAAAPDSSSGALPVSVPASVPAPVPAPLPDTGSYALTPQELVHLVAARNAEAVSGELQTRVADGLLEAERALYEPVLFSRLRREMVDRPRNLDDPLQSPVFGSQEALEEEITQFALGGRRVLPSGAEARAEYRWRERRSSALEGNQEYMGTATISLRQPLLRNRGRLATEADLRVVSLERDVDVQRYRQAVLEASGEAVNAYWQLHRAIEGLAIREQSLETVRQLYKDVARRAEGGFAPRTDLLEARIEVTSRRADVTRAERLVDEAQGRLRTLLNVEVAGAGAVRFEPVVAPSTTIDEDLSLEARLRAARNTWPDLVIARLRARQEAVRLGLAENQLKPLLDLEVGYNWMSIGADDGNAYSGTLSLFNASRYSHRGGWYAGVELEVPVGNSAAEGRVSAQGYRLQQARLRLAAADNALAQDVGTRFRQLRSARAEVDQLREDARLRQELLAAERSQYELGQARLAEVFDREEALNESRQRLVDAVTRFELARLALQLSDGSLLAVFGLRIEVDSNGEEPFGSGS